jgi:hypothetical protein
VENNRKTFYLLLENKDNDVRRVKYILADNPLAKKWYVAMKHLRNVRPHKFDSLHTDAREVTICYKEFCEFAGIEPVHYTEINQQVLNTFHALFIEHNERLSKLKNNHIIYEFHQSIHQAEHDSKNTAPRQQRKYRISYSNQSAPFHEKFPCNLFYSKELIKDNIYLLFSDSGKRPYDYFFDNDTDTMEKVRKTMVANYTFMPNWFVCLESHTPSELDPSFYTFFEKYKSWFLEKFRLNKWDHVDEQSAVLVAETADETDVSKLINSGYFYKTVELHL